MSSGQVDSDIQLQFPLPDPPDGIGLVYSNDASVFNYFRADVQIAHIQGQVHEFTHSALFKSPTSPEYRATVKRLDSMLDRWHAAIPHNFTTAGISEFIPSSQASPVMTLHFMYLECWLLVHNIYPPDADCILRIETYSNGRKVTHIDGDHSSQSESDFTWTQCVKKSRECLKAATRVQLSEFTIL